MSNDSLGKDLAPDGKFVLDGQRPTTQELWSSFHYH